MPGLVNFISLNIRWIVRDRIAQVLVGIALLLMVLVPVFSSFSMRQSQELAVTLALSSISLVLLIYSVFLGSTLLWREIERRYTLPVLALPVPRSTFVLAKFIAIVLLLCAGGILMGVGASIVIKLGAMQYASDFSVQWGRIAIAIGCDILKFALLAAIALAVSAFSTTFFMPFFVSLALYLAGSASQGVYEYISSNYGEKFSAMSKLVIKFVYFVIPNFSVFDFKLQATYPIPLDPTSLVYAVGYFFVYINFVLTVAVLAFKRREML